MDRAYRRNDSTCYRVVRSTGMDSQCPKPALSSMAVLCRAHDCKESRSKAMQDVREEAKTRVQ